MTDTDYIMQAESVPYTEWYSIGRLIEAAPERLKKRLYWIMREKEIKEQMSC